MNRGLVLRTAITLFLALACGSAIGNETKTLLDETELEACVVPANGTEVSLTIRNTSTSLVHAHLNWRGLINPKNLLFGLPNGAGLIFGDPSGNIVFFGKGMRPEGDAIWSFPGLLGSAAPPKELKETNEENFQAGQVYQHTFDCRSTIREGLEGRSSSEVSQVTSFKVRIPMLVGKAGAGAKVCYVTSDWMPIDPAIVMPGK